MLKTGRVGNISKKQQMDNGKSFFMCDDSECDHGKETMMDYELSWVIRLAADKEQCKGNEVLYDKCRAILGKLLGEKCVGEYRVESANVWKQWKRIDLIANIVLENDDIRKNISLLSKIKRIPSCATIN